MLKSFQVIKKNVKPKLESRCIDNWVFRLHYRATTIIFFSATILITLRDYIIGERIHCHNDFKNKKLSKVIETFCFFNGTFSVIDDHNSVYQKVSHSGFHGIRSYIEGSGQTIQRHTYYQWIPYVLFIQGIVFYLTHSLWKSFEDGRINKLVASLHFPAFALLDKEIKIGNQAIPTKEKRHASIESLKDAFLKRRILNKSWASWFVFFEILNFFHVILQVYLTNVLLNKQFYSLGNNLLREGAKVLDEVFPKLTKCTFHKYGHSGSIQTHDSICVLAHNALNEKIYAFLWFWFVFLFAASCSILLWRVVTMACSKNLKFNVLIFANVVQETVHPMSLNMLLKQFSFSEWLFLRYLSKNMNSKTFVEFLMKLAEDLQEKKSDKYMLLAMPNKLE
ncbi:Innexin domain containing protein [Asbolus verrucosus]|uniref:Innexin n=1 Tax=Asbolus verrucosus TaxID=1661398 RepID=A0A482W4S4_ASBVE|nr:Innexin domain containing protein [Asbolus verrucosus]